jgi:DNA-binding SARP family transcriptional activator
MPALNLRLCGNVSVSGAGVVSGGLSDKALGLLAYLALEPGAHSREKLTALLWGNFPDDKAKASLRQALAHVREAIPESIHVERDAVSLVGPLECDVLAFLRAAKESHKAAAEIDVSGFLADLHLRRCPAFDEWADTVRATLARRTSDVLAAATRDSIATRQWREATRLAERWVAADVTSGPATHALMEAHFLSGEPRQALNAFADYRSRMEKADEPLDRAVIELSDRIRDAGTIAARRHATEEWYASAPSFEGSLIGRANEWEALTRNWRRVIDGRPRVILVEGDAGVGRTRLAGDFLRWVTTNGGTVLHGRGYDVAGGVPLGAVIEALRSGLDAPGLAGTDPRWLAEVARLVPELRSRFKSLGEAAPTAAGETWRSLEAIAQLISALAEEAPVAILIDDLHWCDPESCTLLHSLIRKLEDVPVLWCLTFSPGSVQRDAPAARLTRALKTLRHAESLPLQPLTLDELWLLLEALGRVRDDNDIRRLAARIHEVTAGFPFYIVELLKTMFAQGWLSVDPASGEWILQTEDNGDVTWLTIAPTVHEAIAERIECLPEDLAAVLVTLAVSQRGCRTAVLSHVHGFSRLRAAIVGDALVERHLAIEEDEVYRCAHPVIARVVSDALGASRRREVHRSLALSMEVVSSPDHPSDAGTIARHAMEAGERAMAYRYAMRAAEECDARFAYNEAMTWLDLASGAATSPEDVDAVNRTTARLMEAIA